MKIIAALVALTVLSGCAGAAIQERDSRFQQFHSDLLKISQDCSAEHPNIRSQYEACRKTRIAANLAENPMDNSGVILEGIEALQINAEQYEAKKISKKTYEANVTKISNAYSGAYSQAHEIQNQIDMQNAQTARASAGAVLMGMGAYYQGYAASAARQPVYTPNYMSKSVNCTTTYNQPFRSYNTNCY